MSGVVHGLCASYPTPVITGQTQYTTAGTYSWVCPAFVTTIAVVCVGAGGVTSGGGASGGALAYKNNITVVPGTSYTVVVGRCEVVSSVWTRTHSSFTAGFGTCTAESGDFNSSNDATWYYPSAYGSRAGTYDGGGDGGTGGMYALFGDTGYSTLGAGGAGGYSGTGGWAPTFYDGGGYAAVYNGGANGAGGGGGGGHYSGGGVGILGQGSNGTGSANTYNSGGHGSQSTGSGAYGGGGSGTNAAVRIIWGPNRSFPSTNTGNL